MLQDQQQLLVKYQAREMRIMMLLMMMMVEDGGEEKEKERMSQTLLQNQNGVCGPVSDGQSVNCMQQTV